MILLLSSITTREYGCITLNMMSTKSFQFSLKKIELLAEKIVAMYTVLTRKGVDLNLHIMNRRQTVTVQYIIHINYSLSKDD